VDVAKGRRALPGFLRALERCGCRAAGFDRGQERVRKIKVRCYDSKVRESLLSFTPGFSPLRKDRGHQRNRFNGLFLAVRRTRSLLSITLS
jgi:hypothetical protein